MAGARVGALACVQADAAGVLGRFLLQVAVGAVTVAVGAAPNGTLMRFLRAEPPESEVVLSECGVDADAKAAVAFAVPVSPTIQGRISNLPVAIESTQAVVLGQVCRGAGGLRAIVARGSG